MTKVTLYLALWSINCKLGIKDAGICMINTRNIFLFTKSIIIHWELCCWFVSRGAPLIYRACYTLSWVGWFCCCFHIHYVHCRYIQYWHYMFKMVVGFTASLTMHSTCNSCALSTLTLLSSMWLPPWLLVGCGGHQMYTIHLFTLWWKSVQMVVTCSLFIMVVGCAALQIHLLLIHCFRRRGEERGGEVVQRLRGRPPNAIIR